MENLNIRTESKEDIQNISIVHYSAFKNQGEAELVRLIRDSNAFVPELSIVAEVRGKIVGHVFFSRISLTENGCDLKSLSLAPVAVVPKLQRQGIGHRLISEGIKQACSMGFNSILVLGDPAYYGRFGFQHHLTTKIQSPYAGQAFAGLELKPGALGNIVNAVAEYPKAFSTVD